ncbi:MAG: glycosyltransferase family 39 protein [Bacteroidetes bacterium]|nr:glycosyltransferase family 39 protein [Bacteroidota bacterium]MBS1671470.1 glycosyltransferase family 39 protein [Bacteroidota bacterium]
MKSYNWLIAILAIIKLLLPFILQDSFYQLHRDEFLYLAESKHLAWGFMEVPPLLSLLAWVAHLLGNGFVMVKFFPALFGALTFVLTARIILSIGGGLYAIFLSFLAFIFGAYLRVNYLFQPNFLEIFFYTLVAFSVIKYIQTKNNIYIYVFGVACGLGMLSKYSIAFFIIGIIVGLLLSKQRSIFANKHFYFASLIGIIIFLPNILWQYNHNFPVQQHMQELQETQLQYVSSIGFIKDQFLMNLPCVYIWIAGLLFLTLSKKGRQYIFIFWAYTILIMLLIIFHGKNYYALGAYPVLFAFGAYLLERLTRKRVPFMRWVFITITFYFGIIFTFLALPMFPPQKLAEIYKDKNVEKTGALKWEDLQNHALPQDFADMIGWKEITEKTANVYNNLSDEEKSKTIIKCDNYGLCGALNYYGKQYGLPEAYSTNASFLFWMPDTYKVANVITVGENYPDTTRSIVKQFAHITVKDELVDSFARENGCKIILWQHANENILSNFIEKEVAEKKARFIRK